MCREERGGITSLSLKTHCKNPVPSLSIIKKRDFDCCRRLWTHPLILTRWSRCSAVSRILIYWMTAKEVRFPRPVHRSLPVWPLVDWCPQSERSLLPPPNSSVSFPHLLSTKTCTYIHTEKKCSCVSERERQGIPTNFCSALSCLYASLTHIFFTFLIWL